MTVLPRARSQNSHQNGGPVFLIFVADPTTVRLYTNFKIRGLLRSPMPLQPLFEGLHVRVELRG
jgi:hypothetical protein